jgi:hypothetical protein
MLSTAATEKRQYEASDKDRAMLFYQAALWEDCRIAAFRIGQENPDLIFIELDAENFASMRSFKMALTKTLKNIKEKLGGHPTVYWSGRGYHILQPIECTIRLEDIKELAALEPHTSNKFLQFCEMYLSANRYDRSHHPALKSCMLRIPGSLNSRCKAAGTDAEVKILQKWNGHRPDYKLLIGSFYANLIAKNQQLYREYKQLSKSPNVVNAHFGISNNPGGGDIWWIEKLLQTPIDDYRKCARDLILVPYLVLRKDVTYPAQVSDIVMSWADKCAELRSLDPSRREFEHKIWSRTHEVMHDRIPPMKFSTLKEKNPDLYQKISLFRRIS